MTTWIQRRRLIVYLRSSIWVVPFVSVLLVIPVANGLRKIDEATHWVLFGFGVEGARAILTTLAASTLTIMAFMFSALLITVQIASAQLSPRAIVPILGNRPVKFSIALFVFTYLLNGSVLGRTENTVLSVSLFTCVIFGLMTIIVFLYLVDYWIKQLRPISVIERVSSEGRRVIDDMYPYLLTDKEKIINKTRLKQQPDTPGRTVLSNRTDVLLAVDYDEFARLAQVTGGVIEVIPRVGAFIAEGDTLLHIYGTPAALDDEFLCSMFVFGRERTMEQDPMFSFRILVDIAIKALSPAINDPTTAVLAIDQIHRLLRILGSRFLEANAILDQDCRSGVVFHTPDWEDFIMLGVTEIRLYGSDSMQVVRRLRAMLENLENTLPPERRPVLKLQLQLLDRAVKRSFQDPADRARAGIADYQGVGADAGDEEENIEPKSRTNGGVRKPKL